MRRCPCFYSSETVKLIPTDLDQEILLMKIKFVSTLSMREITPIVEVFFYSNHFVFRFVNSDRKLSKLEIFALLNHDSQQH